MEQTNKEFDSGSTNFFNIVDNKASHTISQTNHWKCFKKHKQHERNGDGQTQLLKWA